MNHASLFPRVAIIAALALATACTGSPVRSNPAANARARLTQLQQDPQLAPRAPVAIREAEAAVRLAEVDVVDADLLLHRVVLAERRVEIARAQAQRRYDEDQVAVLSQERDNARLASRTREADSAREDATLARREADFARLDAASAREESADLERQLAGLHVKATDRGLVVVLGDVMFEPGQASLKGGKGPNGLDRLAAFLADQPARAVTIEGHTDSVGSAAANRVLSQRRADAVRNYLEQRGVAPGRVVAAGRGEDEPTADNATVTGRQQNRRVEVIISNGPG